jgi:hypothetical protein
VSFVLDKSAQAAIDAVVIGIAAWGRRWLKRRREKDPNTPPIRAVIYAPNGKVLREVEVKPEDQDD